MNDKIKNTKSYGIYLVNVFPCWERLTVCPNPGIFIDQTKALIFMHFKKLLVVDFLMILDVFC